MSALVFLHDIRLTHTDLKPEVKYQEKDEIALNIIQFWLICPNVFNFCCSEK